MENSINKELMQIRQLPTAKEEIVFFVSKIEEALDNGELNASEIALKFKAIEKVAELLKSKMTALVVDEISKFPKSEAEIQGATFKVSEFGHKYHYKTCGDTIWEKLKEDLDKADKALKQRESFLKAINGHETCVNETTGEIITLYPPLHTSTTGISITIKD